VELAGDPKDRLIRHVGRFRLTRGASTGRFAREPMDAMIRKAAKNYVVAAG
jgi:hypothetical protein